MSTAPALAPIEAEPIAPPPPSPVPAAGARHVPALDGLRGLAVLCVMLTHFVLAADGRIEKLADPTAWDRLIRSGWRGVDLFFVLSGYLITARLLAAPRVNYFRHFYVRRLLRIAPLYYLVITVAFLSVPLLSPWDSARLVGASHPVWYYLYVPNLAMGWVHHWLSSPRWLELSHFWSLAVEEQFYLIWPLFTRFVPRLGLWLACAVLIIVANQWSDYLWDQQRFDDAYVLTFCRMDALAWGALLATVEHHAEVRWVARAAGKSAVMLAITLAILIGSDIASPYTTENLSLALFMTLVLAGTGPGRVSTLLAHPVLRWFGTYSYGLYVFHHLLRPVWVTIFPPATLKQALGSRHAGMAAYVLLAGGASVLLSYASWHLLEKRALKLKDRFGA